MPTDGREDPAPTPTEETVDATPGAAKQPAGVMDQTHEEKAARPRIPVDLVSGLFLLTVVAVFVLNAGEDPLDWIFPLTLSYTLGIIAIYLTIRGLLGYGDKVETLLPVLRGRGIDVLIFTVIAAIYVSLVRAVGFWTTSALMLFAGSVFLDHARSRKRIALSAVVAVAVCLAAYVLLVQVLFVPLPREAWLAR